jgi:hypothetical protein
MTFELLVDFVVPETSADLLRFSFESSWSGETELHPPPVLRSGILRSRDGI